MQVWQRVASVSGLLLMMSVAQAGVSLPKAFQGKWAPTAAGCKVPMQVIALQGSSLQGGDGGGEVMSLTVISPRQVQVQMKMSGGGSEWEEKQSFFLSHDGKSLLWLSVLDKPMDSEWSTLVRCK
ncbi:hypothetical protein [Leeia aquatica]|uniref:Uncharacterized protein n=1 Tax=Leeia aquatica TaxID=2725557 RepID=A0A847S5E9_9NEIS|nr:hypothetical protein [Leeia aquatica]NLR74015.1 hypothetical protein [Leeia aquatica]